jgi:hypothetical protein
MKKQIRQGDVYLIPVSEFPKNIKIVNRENERIILAKGEVTGHHHAIKNKSANLFKSLDETLFLEVTENVELEHEEHSAIEIEPGLYKMIPQREYHPLEIKKVVD